MPKPIVAVVGRPNVGKSTLVNRIAQTREAIVHESRGVTRDRSYHEADWNGVDFVMVDTGGIESVKSTDVFSAPIREQALAAVEEADVILFVVDGTTGPTEEDEEVARVLRSSKKPCFLCANKYDEPANEEGLWDFYSLGLGEPMPISAIHGHGTGDLLDEVVDAFPEEGESEYPEDMLNVAIVGRPNVGKSSLANRIAGTERSIVSDISGTTRDAIDIMVEHEGTPIRLVDTAGMRKRANVHEDIEFYSTVRGLRAMEQADVCLLVVDSSVGVTEQDQKICEMAIDRGCALAVLLNKWDLLEDDQDRQDVMDSLTMRLTFADWAPVLRISALTGRSVGKVLDLAIMCAENRASRVNTARLNAVMAKIRETGHTVVERTRRLKINYATQTSVDPPSFTFFCNSPDLVNDNYRRFLENRLREAFELDGTPIRLRFRSKDRS